MGLGLSEVKVHQEPSQAAKHRFLPFCQNALRTYLRMEKIRLLKYPYAVNARDLKKRINFVNGIDTIDSKVEN